MNDSTDSVYRRLCMTSVCGAILIPATMALVAEYGTSRDIAGSTPASIAVPDEAVAASSTMVATGAGQVSQIAQGISTSR